MSQISRLLTLGSRLYSRRLQVAVAPRSTALIQQPFMRFAARMARPVEDSDRRGANGGNKLRDALRTLNEQVQRTGRVYHSTVLQALLHAEAQGDLSGVECQLLLRATGSFLKDIPPAKREEMTNRVWELTPKERLDISHYNTLLHVKLENGTPFDPSSFLQELSEAKIAPNRVTYQRLIQRYCETGDVQNATKIIEFMKSQDLPIAEKVFHSLITGYLRSGDAEGAKNVLKVMESATLKPTSETYTVLAVGLIEAGDIKAAMEILADKAFIDEQILRIVKALALKDDLESCHKALETISDATINFSNVNNVCVELLVSGKVDAAVSVLRRAQDKSTRKDAGNLLVISAARLHYTADEVHKLCEQLEGIVTDNIFVDATYAAIRQGDPARGKEFIEKMKQLGHPIRAHYYLPFLCTAADDAAVLSELKTMFSLDPSLDEYLKDFVLQRLDTSDVDKVRSQLLDIGFSAEAVTDALAVYLLRSRRLADAEKILSDSKVSSTLGLPGVTAFAVRSVEDLPTAIRILSILVENSDPRHDVVSRFLDNSGRFINEAIQAVAKTDLPIGQKAYNRLKTAGANVEPLQKNILEIADHRRIEDFEKYGNRSTEELEALVKQGEEENKDVSRLLGRLLNDYCMQRFEDKAEELLRKIPPMSLSAANLSNLVHMYTQLGNSERASELYNQALERNFHLNPHRTLALAKLLVENKRLFEASELIEKASSNISLSLDSFQIDIASGRLVTAIYRNYGKDACFNFYERYIQKYVNSRALGFLLRDLINEDVLEAYELFKEIAYKFQGLPCRRYLCMKLIEQNKTEELGTLIEIMRNNLGPVDAATDLALCYLECNKLNEAKDQLLAAPGRRGRANLIRACNTYMSEGKHEHLDALLGLLEETGLHSDTVSLFRIRQYAKRNDVASALDVWTQSQEDNIPLPPYALETLADLLVKNGQPVPFIVPTIERLSSDPQQRQSHFRTILDDSVDRALEHRATLKAQGGKLADSETAALLHELVSAERMKEAFEVAEDLQGSELRGRERQVRMALTRLRASAASKGMIDELESYCERSGTHLGKHAIMRAYIEAGRFEEYVTKLESQPLEEISFFIEPSVFDEHPEIAARLEALAHRLGEDRGFYAPLSDLWYTRILRSETDKAVELLNRYPPLRENLTRLRPSVQIKKSLDREFFDRAVQITEDEGVRRKILQYVLGELAAKDDVAEMKSCVDFAAEIGVDTSKLPQSFLQKCEAYSGEDSGADASGHSSHRQEVEARSA